MRRQHIYDVALLQMQPLKNYLCSQTSNGQFGMTPYFSKLLSITLVFATFNFLYIKVGRHNIRKVIKDKHLADETKEAATGIYF